jgi:hypothetical protein
MKSSLRIAAVVFSLIGWLGVSSVARADIIHYGNFVGTNVHFLDVQESSGLIGNGPGQVPELYGPPSVLGNFMVFFPSLFEANAGSGQNVIVDGQLSFDLLAKPGYLIKGIVISEFGDYTLSTPLPGGSAFASNSISAFSTSVNGTVSNSALFSHLHDNSISNGIFGASWTNGTSLTFIPVNATHFTMDNTLNAAAAQISAAFIKKKGVSIQILVAVIPEPASALTIVSLLGCFGGIAFYRRK